MEFTKEKVENLARECLSEQNFELKKKQIEVISNILNGKDVLAILPTGYGKSLIYQLLPTLWKMLMLAWSYHKGLAVPAKDSKRPFVGGLSRLVKTGYSTNVLKLFTLDVDSE